MPILSWEQVAAAALLGGWNDSQAVVAASITQPESSRDDTNIQPGQPYATTGWGLWQITPGNSEPQFGINNAMLNPLNNAKAGHAKYVSQGWSAWTTWVNGLNVPFLGDAGAAVNAVRGMSTAQLLHLLGAKGTPGGGGQPSAIPRDLDWSPEVKEGSAAVGQGAATLVTYGHSVAGLKPVFVAPKVIVPSPATLLWVPGERMPA